MRGSQQQGTGDYYFIENEGEISRLVNLGFRGVYSFTCMYNFTISLTYDA